ncbi:MAG: HAD family hydrolase [Lentisphaeraceae bacterium]|nr:HAD family hydrolase [Lentisphaeraceae bacterium]
MPDLADKCVVFDLDDTLYKEKEYVLSGLKAVAEFVSKLYGKDFHINLREWYNQGEKDIFSKLCNALQLPESVKSSFIWKYRLHEPDISLDNETAKVLSALQNDNVITIILTDGRSVTQRLKLGSLGLENLPIYISEEYSSEKPEKIRFEKIESKHKAKHYFYIGDNPKKDFLAANELGWVSIGLIGDEDNIHSQNMENLEEIYLPQFSANSISAVYKLVRDYD